MSVRPEITAKYWEAAYGRRPELSLDAGALTAEQAINQMADRFAAALSRRVAPALLSPEDAAAYLGVGVTTIKLLRAQGHLHAVRITATRIGFQRAELDRFINLRREDTPEKARAFSDGRRRENRPRCPEHGYGHIQGSMACEAQRRAEQPGGAV